MVTAESHVHGVSVTERAIHLEMVEMAYFLHYVHFITVEKGRGGGESGEERR